MQTNTDTNETETETLDLNIHKRSGSCGGCSSDDYNECKCKERLSGRLLAGTILAGIAMLVFGGVLTSSIEANNSRAMEAIDAKASVSIARALSGVDCPPDHPDFDHHGPHEFDHRDHAGLGFDHPPVQKEEFHEYYVHPFPEKLSYGTGNFQNHIRPVSDVIEAPDGEDNNVVAPPSNFNDAIQTVNPEDVAKHMNDIDRSTNQKVKDTCPNILAAIKGKSDTEVQSYEQLAATTMIPSNPELGVKLLNQLIAQCKKG